MLVDGEAERLWIGFLHDSCVSPRSKLSLSVIIMSAILASAVSFIGCAAGEGKVTPVYDPSTRDLIRLDYNGPPGT